MTDTILYVDKGTDQMRSTFVALGLADLFFQIDEAGSGVDIILRDMGSAYQLTINRSREDILALVHRRGLPQVLPAILAPSASEEKEAQAGTLPEHILHKYVPREFQSRRIVDYRNEQGKPENVRKSQKNKVREETDMPGRSPQYPLWAHLCSNFIRGKSKTKGYPFLTHMWHAHTGEQCVRLSEILLDAYVQFPNELETAQKNWEIEIKPTLDYPDFNLVNWDGKSTVSALSIVSPTTAQGSFTATGAKTLNNQPQEVFWLEMYLAFAGYMVAGMPYRAEKDALLYYPLPRMIQFSALRNLVETYRKSVYVNELYDRSNYMPRAKVDVLSQNAFYKSMVQHYLDNPPQRRQPNAIYGLTGYYYKNLSGHVPFDETTFTLPPWLSLDEERSGLEDALDVLEEHYRIIRNVEGELRGSPPRPRLTSDELAVFDSYRQFVTSDDPDECPENWIDFALIYGIYYFNHMGGTQKYLAALWSNIWEKTLMNMKNIRTDYGEIYKNPGFQKVAQAIRFCTTELLWRTKGQSGLSSFQVRYGLDADLLRHADNPDLFLGALSEFLKSYAWEREKVGKSDLYGEYKKTPLVSDDDFYQVADLTFQYGSRLVARMLVAAGYLPHFSPKKTENE